MKIPGDIAWRIGTEKDDDGHWCGFRQIEGGESPTHMFFVGLDGLIGLIALRPETLGNGHSWEFDGNLDAPTIRPSIDGGAGRWHGWITKGVMQ
jgi:hypothetical protein